MPRNWWSRHYGAMPYAAWQVTEHLIFDPDKEAENILRIIVLIAEVPIIPFYCLIRFIQFTTMDGIGFASIVKKSVSVQPSTLCYSLFFISLYRQKTFSL